MVSLFDVFAKNNGDAKANYIALSGLCIAFRTADSGPLIAELFKTNVVCDILFGNRSLYNVNQYGDLLSTSFTYAKKNGIDLSVKPGFKEWIASNANRLKTDLMAGKYKNYWEHPDSDYVAVIEAGFLSGAADPEALFKQKFSKYGTSYRLGAFDCQLLKSIANRSPKLIVEQIEHIDFSSSAGYGIRSEIYAAIAETGYLTKKAARKIRSDASEEAASNGIRTIADNIHKFPNANEVLSQVMDTKYFAPAKYLAETIPRELLPFMVCCQDQKVREIIVARMQESEK